MLQIKRKRDQYMKLAITDYIQICAQRGLTVSVKQMQYLLYKNRIPARKIAGLWFVDEKDAMRDKSFFLIEQLVGKRMTRRK